MPTRGRGKWKTRERRNHSEVECWHCWRSPFIPLWRTSETGCSWGLHQNWLYLIVPAKGTPLCMIVQAEWAWCTTTTLEEQTPEGSEIEEVPAKCKLCLLLAQQQTVKTPLGWVNRKLCAILWTFSGASFLDQGWKVWCRGTHGVWGSQWWCSGSAEVLITLVRLVGYNHGYNELNPTSLHSRDFKLITLGGMKWEH